MNRNTFLPAAIGNRQRLAILAWLLVALLIAAAGGALFWYARLQVLAYHWGLLDALATERLREIASWRYERARDLTWLTAPSHQHVLATELRGTGRITPALIADLNHLLSRPPYLAGFIVDARGELRHHSGEALIAPSRLPALIQQAGRSHQPVFFDGVLQTGTQRALRVIAMAPVYDAGRFVGAVGLQMDPEAADAPLVAAFPSRHSTSEILVFRRDGTRITYLTGPRFAAGREFSITPFDALLAEQVLRGERRVTGEDYRHRPAMGVGAPVPGTPWHLIAKVDRDDVSGPIQRLALASAALVLLLMGSTAFAARRWWREEEIRARARSYETELAHAAERGRDAARIRRLNDFLTVLSRGNATIIHERDPGRRLQAACDIAVDGERFARAWIASPDASGTLLLTALAGDSRNGQETWDPSLSARALAQAAPVQATDRTPDNGSAAALPIRGRTRTLAVLGVASRDPEAFDTETMEILDQLSSDLGYALEHIESERARSAAEHFRHASEERLSRVLESAGEGIYGVGTDGRVSFINAAGARMLGYGPEELLGVYLHTLIHSRHADGTPYPAKECRLYAAGRDGVTLSDDDEFFWRKDGSGFPIAFTATPLRDEAGAILGSVVVFQDITARKQAEEQRRLAAQVFESSHEAILILDEETRIVSANSAFTAITGYQPAEVLGRSPATLLNSGEQDDAFYERIWQTVQRDGHWVGELRDRRKNGEVFPLWLSISAVQDRHNKLTHYIAIATDLSEHEAAQEQIQKLAYHDPLTGLSNRTLLLDRLNLTLAHAKRRQERVAVLFVDIDHFKNVNDSLGHLLGDAMLREIANRLRLCVRQDDTVARQGGDEFILVLGELRSPEDANNIALKVLGEIARPFRLAGAEVRTTATIGIALHPEDGSAAEALIRNANAALHHAKLHARGSLRFFVPELNQRARERLAMETNLRRAVEQNSFELHYQPQVSARTGRMMRVEALLRWRADERLVSPTKFVPLAEENGLIVPIGEWVAHEACRQQRAWIAEGLPSIPIAFNVSGAQFKDPHAMKRLRDILITECPDTHTLEVELTEGVIMEEAESSLQILADLKSAGIGLAIDDFGTGYSSLSYLRRFPMDRLKVDQSFIRRLPGQPADRAVVEAIINLARGLGLTVIAEGVETDAVAGFLRARNCDELQGFYFSEPLPPSQLAAWWRHNGGSVKEQGRSGV